jgi:serine protease Do
MDRSLPHHRTSRTKTRRLAYASALAALALAGVVGLGLPQSAVHAQLKPDAAIQMPGRAPLSFADIVDRVKPAVVSIHVTNGGSQP